MLYLSPYVGYGTRERPFTPRGFRNPGVGTIDLRADCTRADGYALMWMPSGIPAEPGMIKLADGKADRLARSSQRDLMNRWPLNYAHDHTIADAVETLLLRPAVGHWGPLRPSRGRVEAWLGAEKWVDFALPMGMTVRTDDFNRANEDPMAGNWTTPVARSPFKIVSNQLVGNNTGDSDNYAFWNADSFGADQFSQIQLVTFAAASPGLTLRGSGASRDYYGFQYFAGPVFEIFKYVAGSYTPLNSPTASWTNGDYARFTVAGTTLTGYSDASNPPTTQIAQTTDGTFASGSPGIYNFFGNANIFDNWSGGDGTGIATAIYPARWTAQ